MNINKNISIFLLFVMSIYAFENKYTIIGEMSYYEVFKILADNSNRSINGVSSALGLVRNFHIDNRPFTSAIEQIKKDLKTDGYRLVYDSLSFDIYDTISPSRDSSRSIFLPFSKRWRVTSKKEEILNAIIDDSLEHNELIAKENLKKKKLYEFTAVLVGTNLSSEKVKGIILPQILSIDLSVVPYSMPTFKINFGATKNDYEDSLNFCRNYKFYFRDSLNVYRFGTESRRVNSRIESEKILSENYESVYDGLTLRVTPYGYFLSYRVGNTNIDLSGVSDSICYGYSDVKTQSTSHTFYLPKKSFSKNTFSLFCVATIRPIGD